MGDRYDVRDWRVRSTKSYERSDFDLNRYWGHPDKNRTYISARR